jgi:hypothetical protein
LLIFDSDLLQTNGNLVTINLRSSSITGPILGITTSFVVTNEFLGIATFSFNTPVAVVPGVTYYIQPVIQPGDSVSTFVTAGYTDGTAIVSGVPLTDRDFWFREGVVVPEPAAVSLVLLGAGLILGFRRSKSRCS